MRFIASSGVEADPEMVERKITCRGCGGPLAAREGKFLLKYFLLRKGGRTQGGEGLPPEGCAIGVVIFLVGLAFH
jgi:hypothetical protein